MRIWIAIGLNFFFPGAGWLLLGQRRLQAICWLFGVIGLTYVETSIQTAAPTYYWCMFGSVLVMNTGFAFDTWIATRPAATCAPAV